MDKAAHGRQISEEYLRGQAIKEFKRVGVTLRRVATRIKQALDATETKATYDKDRGKWVYSAPMIDWGARSKAVDQAICVLDLKPAERHQVEHTIDGELSEVVRDIIKGVAEYDQK